MVYVVIVSRYRNVPFRSVLFRRIGPFRCLVREELSRLILPMFVIGFLEAICEGTCRGVVLARRFAPFVYRRYTVYLGTVVGNSAAYVFFLGFRNFLVGGWEARRDFSPVPNGRGLQRNLQLGVFFGGFLRWFVTRRVAQLFLVWLKFFRVMAVVANRVAGHACEFNRCV